MATNLGSMKCEACRAGAPQVTDEEAQEYRAQTPGWQIIRDDSIDKLSKTYSFKNWQEAMAFANRVGDLAEQEQHHPALLVEWGRVTVTWWTHKIGGLHKNDFIMAAKCETLVPSARPGFA
jgi:4a-hydroxytetrahydrobiopterin dehydratase